ncbi:MAG: hypothetical protein ACON5A_03030 [Candidatus Comchoanobacterales bacterium]
MKKLVSLLAVGALSVGFAEDDTKDYLKKPSNDLTILKLTQFNLILGEKAPDFNPLLDFFKKVNDDPENYLEAFKNSYQSYADAYKFEKLYLNEAACKELSQIITKRLYQGTITVFGYTQIPNVINLKFNDSDKVIKWDCSSDYVCGIGC